ncbi:MAG: hypothetical protein KAH32_01020 [Chlamydiia bacterium]|nr:hypothetical protein [Chlamydiia bacterium]
MLDIVRTTTGIVIPAGTGEYIAKLMTTSLTHLSDHEIRVILGKGLPLAGLDSSKDMITK